MASGRALLLVIVAALPSVAVAQCPNACSGHGKCGDGNACSCFDGWDYAPDCSLRTCSKGPAWADKAYATDTAHTSVECSNGGLCDRATGICQCFDGYTGAACSRATCPNDCSGRGQCMTIGDLGKYEGADYDQPGLGGDGVGPIYSNWDSAATTACVCYAGYFGADCSQSMCPKADDPVTTGQNYRRVMVNVGSQGTSLTGTVSITFNGYTTSFTANSGQMTSARCETAFEKLDNVQDVDCSLTVSANDNAQYNVTFLEFPIQPAENNLHSHTGNPSIDSFTCDISEISGDLVYCNITDVLPTTNIREYVFCAGRGLCDFDTGDCTCFDGYTGLACEQESYYQTTANDDPGIYIETFGTDYTGAAVAVQTAKAAATDFHMMQFKAKDQTVFAVRGDGHLFTDNIKADTVEATQALISSNGGMTVYDEGALIQNQNPNSNALKVRASDAAFTENVVEIEANSNANQSAYHLIHAGEVSTDRFTVRGDGRTTVHTGGLKVKAGGTTLQEGGVYVTNGGVTIENDGLKVTDGGLKVRNGGATIESGTVNATVLTLTADSTTSYGNGSVLLLQANRPTTNYRHHKFYLINTIADADDNPTTIFTVTSQPKTNVHAGGLGIVGGATVSSGGLYVSAGGETINAGNLEVSAGTTTTVGLSSSAAVSGTSTAYFEGTTTTVGLSSSAAVSGTSTAYFEGTTTTVGLSSSAAVSGTSTAYFEGITTTVGLSSSAAVSGTSTAHFEGITTVAGLVSSAAVTGATTAQFGGTTTTVGLSSSAAVSGTSTAHFEGITTVAGLVSTAVISGTSSAYFAGSTTTAGLVSTAVVTGTGSAYFGSNVYVGGSAVQTSDAAFKTDVQTIDATHALSTVLQLRPVLYKWRAEHHAKYNQTLDTRPQVGFIAQEVHETLSQHVRGANSIVSPIDTSGHLGVSYDRLTPLLTGAVQAQHTQNQLLEARVAELERQAAGFEARAVQAEERASRAEDRLLALEQRAAALEVPIRRR